MFILLHPYIYIACLTSGVSVVSLAVTVHKQFCNTKNLFVTNHSFSSVVLSSNSRVNETTGACDIGFPPFSIRCLYYLLVTKA